MLPVCAILCQSTWPSILQGRCYWVGRVGIYPPSFLESLETKTWSVLLCGKVQKIAKFMRLVNTYFKFCQNLRSCFPSFYKIVSPLHFIDLPFLDVWLCIYVTIFKKSDYPWLWTNFSTRSLSFQPSLFFGANQHCFPSLSFRARSKNWHISQWSTLWRKQH